MTDHKLLRYISKTFVLPSDPVRLVPVIITDSKAKYIKNYCINPVENRIKWWFKPGQNSTQGLAWLRDSLETRIGYLDNISLYVWLGTCDFTVYDRKTRYITLKQDLKEEIQTLINNLKEIKGLITVHPECKVTFLEIPIFSIYLWNKCMNHPEINQFKEEDNTLIVNIHEANSQIRQLNNVDSKRSPNFSTDIYHPTTCKSKNKHNKPRDLYNFNLYKDGLHPDINLAKVWLRKITERIKIDCY